MDEQSIQAQDAIKSEFSESTLPYLIKYLQKEKSAVVAELEAMTPEAWLDSHGRALANREQELYTTLAVLRGLAQRPAPAEDRAA